ncbi:DUF421 domain-containing protein [Bacillus timonensis]|uniref:DUF421 domain-containing protein n=2 Tax=Bacillus timonensis TaxID=1033734 RepID=A0A4S3PUZ5_9BACI|nr:DUF421 domain-containing protein [Bacillus timonensis]
MTLAQTIVMISIGTIIVQPMLQKDLVKTLVGAGIFVATMLIIEYLELKFNIVEKFITGKSKIVIENGSLNIKNLKKLRLTVDQLEMRFRNQGISTLNDIKTATIEPNGLLGYELKEEAKPLTVGEFKKLLDSYFPSLQNQEQNQSTQKDSIFEEISHNKPQDHPKYLQ